MLRRARLLALALLLSGCSGGPRNERADSGPPAVPAAPPPPESPAPPPEPEPPHAPLTAGEVVAIPAGIVRVGSAPGTVGRDPRREADLVPVEVPAFTIDRLPYPNDPGQPPRTGVTREEASALCAAEDKRLCTELEWERACKGDTTREYPGAQGFDVESCSLDPLSCASPLDVVSLGVSTFEWTATDVSRYLGSERYSAVVRGGRTSDPAPEHRCGARHALAPDDSGPEIGFRCCAGEEPELTYPEEPGRRAFREREIELSRLRSILAGIPQLAPFAADFELVDATGVDRALGRGGHSRETVQWNFVEEEVLVWSPLPGEELWVLSGTGGGSALIAALYTLPDGSFSHAASFVLRDEPVPVLVAWDVTSRDEVLWSACWACAGEGGAILRRDDSTFVVVQR